MRSDVDDGRVRHQYFDRESDLYLFGFLGYAEQGQRSQGGALLHEVSHFMSVAGTLDIDNYNDPWSCQGLANCDPAQAIINSYNHQYFAESYPLIPPLGCPCSIGRRNAAGSAGVLMFAVFGAAIVIRARMAAVRRRNRGRRDAG